MFIRVLNTGIGIWLCISAFLLGNLSRAVFFNTWIVGILVTAFGIAAILGADWARRLNFLLALWLFLSCFVLPMPPVGVIFHHIIMSVLLVVTSLFPPATVPRGAHQPA